MAKTTRQLIVNEAGNDLSYEGYTILAVMLEMVWASQVMGTQLASALDNIGARGTLVQRRKKALNDARAELKKFLGDIAIAFDDEFAKVFNLENGAARYEYIQAMANDIISMLLIYYSRCDGDDEKRDRMKKALANFKPSTDLDLDAMLDFFKFNRV